MKETIKGWVARDNDQHLNKLISNNKGLETSFFEFEPKQFPIRPCRWKVFLDRGAIFLLENNHGLKPGEIKRATLTIERDD